jgi:hypothetical protein
MTVVKFATKLEQFKDRVRALDYEARHLWGMTPRQE